MSLPPGPRRPRVLQSIAWLREPAELLLSSRRRFGPRFTLRFTGPRDYVIVSDPEAVKAVFTGPPDVFVSGRGNQNLEPFFGKHSMLTMPPGDEHRRQRKLLGPPLRGERMREYGALIHRLSADEMATWSTGRPFSILDAMKRVTLQAIFGAVFGVRDSERARRLAELTGKLTAAVAWFGFLRVPRIDAGPYSPWGSFLRSRREFDALLRDEIARARREGDDRQDILAQLLAESERTGAGFGDAETSDALITLLAAGHETSAATAAWAFQWILRDRAVRQRVREEAARVLDGGALDPAQLGDLPFTRAAIMESLRLTPVVPIVPRWLEREVEIGRTRLPGGHFIAASPLIAQRDPERYPDPERYVPERFTSERPGPFEYFPFGGGSRLCIGGSFALYELTAILASVVARADLELADERPQRISRHGLTLVPADGTPVILRAPVRA